MAGTVTNGKGMPVKSEEQLTQLKMIFAILEFWFSIVRSSKSSKEIKIYVF